VKLLVIAPSYPQPGAEWIGAPNEHSARALQGIVEHLEVLTPRPYAPRFLAVSPRWKTYALAPREHAQAGIRVHRPAYPILPGIMQACWPVRPAFVFARPLARRLHRRAGFDAILSFDLALTGGLAWRLGRDLGIPACGWATGSDIRADGRSATGRNVRDALAKLDLVFYQSAELKALGAALLGTHPEALARDRHIVQPRGVQEPETFPGDEVRRSVRSRLAVSDRQIVILYLGRIVRGKGLFDLVEGFGGWAREHADLVLLLVGSIPGYDETAELQRKIRSLTGMDRRIRVLPACPPPLIWEYFKAADIFAFPSVKEGMPNSLLEAMLAGLPAVALSIPAVREIARFGQGLVEAPAHESWSFGQGLLKLAADPLLRREVGERGRAIVREHFSLHRNMRTVVDHIQKAIRS
jgi:glycosyltransferase involved in cell wall biosynthesis